MKRLRVKIVYSYPLVKLLPCCACTRWYRSAQTSGRRSFTLCVHLLYPPMENLPCCTICLFVQVSADEWEEKLQALVAERMQQLEELRRRLAGVPEGGDGDDDMGEGEEGEEEDEGEEEWDE